MNNLSRKIVLIGGGGHCHSVIDSVTSQAHIADLVITDRDDSTHGSIHGYEVVGNDNMLDILYREGYRDAFVCIGSIKDSSARRVAFERANALGFTFPNIIDPSATIADDVMVMDGIFIGKKAVINSGSRIAGFAIINTGAIIEHDCIIGEFSHVSVGAVVCGGCRIGNDVFIGANATVIQGVSIGNNSIIGAGSTVLADVPSNALITGVWGGS